jgi:hypothetical protein
MVLISPPPRSNLVFGGEAMKGFFKPSGFGLCAPRSGDETFDIHVYAPLQTMTSAAQVSGENGAGMNALAQRF